MEAFKRAKSDPNINILSPLANNFNYNLTTKSKNKLEISGIPIDSPKNINMNFTNSNLLHSHTLNPMNTNNSLGLNFKKFSLTNPNYSKLGSLNSSSMSKNPITNFISTSTLQSGVASYTIPREKRFNESRNNFADSVYNLPEFKSTGITMPQSTRKSNFVKKDMTPSSQDYIFTSVFEDNVKHRKGISITNKHAIKVRDFLFFVFF